MSFDRIYVILLCPGIIQALICYNCTNWVGVSESKNCLKHDPGSKHLIDCRSSPRSAEPISYGAVQNPTTKVVAGDISCVKVVGKINTTANSSYLYRTCVVVNWSDDREGRCLETNNISQILIPGKGEVFGKICYCSTTKCNMAFKRKPRFILLITTATLFVLLSFFT